MRPRDDVPAFPHRHPCYVPFSTIVRGRKALGMARSVRFANANAGLGKLCSADGKRRCQSEYGFLAVSRDQFLPFYLFPGFPGLVPGPSLTFGFPGGCGSGPLPTPLLPFL